jgi:hypothetical protein
MVGNFLYGRTNLALILLGILIISGLALIGVINRLWAGVGEGAPASAPLRSSETLVKRQ